MKYEINITFTTDRELTPEEQSQIAGACQVQVEEPTDEQGDEMNIHVSEVNARISKATISNTVLKNFHPRDH